MINVIILVGFIIINIFLAKIDANKISKGKNINHLLNGLIYLTLITAVYLITKDIFLSVGLLVLRVPIFNTFLNYFRELPLDYISKSTTSIIDKLTNWIPLKIGYWVYHITLLLISLILCLIF